jgi:hypothetical protein
MIHPGDTQPVQFFKSPDEAVGIFRPEQMAAIGEAMAGANVQFGDININTGGQPMTRQSMYAIRDEFERAVKDAFNRP